MAATGFRLQTLLDTRRLAEDEAARALGAVTALLTSRQKEQQRLEAQVAEAQHLVRAAQAQRAAHAPADAAAGQAAELFRRRRESELHDAEATARAHREGLLAEAEADRQAARCAHLECRRDRQALEQVKQRQEREARRLSQRRAEDAASDLALAANHKKKTERE